jgi:predicted signal transduction protein with EAL and GGDEF domain
MLSLAMKAMLRRDDARGKIAQLAEVLEVAPACRAKAEGRGRARFFKADMDKSLRERHALRHDLSLAIERDEFTMFYQPQADQASALTANLHSDITSLFTGGVTGAKALAIMAAGGRAR